MARRRGKGGTSTRTALALTACVLCTCMAGPWILIRMVVLPRFFARVRAGPAFDEQGAEEIRCGHALCVRSTTVYVYVPLPRLHGFSLLSAGPHLPARALLLMPTQCRRTPAFFKGDAGRRSNFLNVSSRDGDGLRYIWSKGFGLVADRSAGAYRVLRRPPWNSWESSMELGDPPSVAVGRLTADTISDGDLVWIGIYDLPRFVFRILPSVICHCDVCSLGL